MVLFSTPEQGITVFGGLPQVKESIRKRPPDVNERLTG